MNNPDGIERRRLNRRNISHHVPILDYKTQKVIGQLVDISPAGLLMDSAIPIPTDQTYILRLDFADEFNGKASLQLTARTKWCREEPNEPSRFNAGFEISDLVPADYEIITLLAKKYGSG